MRKIDFHVHAYPNQIAPKVINSLTAIPGMKSYTDGTLEDAKRVMSEWGTEAFVFPNIATTPSQQQNCNDFSIASNGNGIYAFGSVHPLSDNWSSELDRIHKAGLKGIKIHNEYQGFDATDPKAYPIYEKAASLGLILMFHGGFDPAFPQRDYASPAKLSKVADRLRGAKIVIAHLGNALNAKGVMEHLAGKDVYLDTSMIHNMVSTDKARRIIDAHGADRILYASDCPWGCGLSTQQYIESLGLSEDALKKIYYKNALELLGG